MSALQVQASTGETSITSTARTVLTATAAANQRVKIRGYGVYGKGTSNTDSPVKVELITYSTISGGTTGSVTVSKMDGDSGETVQTTIAGNYTAEPTYSGNITVRTPECHPQQGCEVYFPNDFCIVLKGGTGFAIRATSVQNETMTFQLFLEE